jgi:dihydrofolate synthase/folylpolyglutamate synthase
VSKETFDSYSQVVEYLFRQLPMYQRVGPKAFKKNLDNIIALCDALDNPEKKFKSIHIAGTNGKGSVTHILAALCSNIHGKIGIYTSPHLRDYRERIKINDTYITESGVIEFVNDNRGLIEQIKPSFFEITVAMAFWWFAKEKVDIAIIETGLGGRLDSTNVVMPEVSVITNIGNDHKNFLGDTLDLIAGEKAGIIKQYRPVVIGQRHPETEPVFIKSAEKCESEITFAEDYFRVVKTDDSNLFQTEYRITGPGFTSVLSSDLNGIYQAENIQTALGAYWIYLKTKGEGRVDWDLHLLALSDIREKFKFSGRWQVLSPKPLTIMDGGHNPEGLDMIMRQLELMSYDQLHLVLGFVMEKDPFEMLSNWPKEARFYLCQADIPRAMPLDVLQSAADQLGLNATSYTSVQEALKTAQFSATKNDMVFVGGSLYIVAEVV